MSTRNESMVTDRFDYVFWMGDFNYRITVLTENLNYIFK